MSDVWYFEDIEVGAVFTSPARTITEADIVNFAGLSGDYNLLHTNEEYAKQTIFGQRVAHGMLGLVVASGLFTRTELSARLRGTSIALLGVNWKFMGPLKIGDTIRVEVEVKSKKESSKPGRGLVNFERRVLNQRDEVIQAGEMPYLVKTKNG